jgi:hypothetical protein
MKKSYSQFIQELFNSSPSKWKNIGKTNIYAEDMYSFEIDTYTYNVLFFKENQKNEKPVITVEFQLEKIGDVFFDVDKNDKLTKTGNQYQVFVTVIDIWKYFMKKHPEYEKYKILASQKEQSRVSLYKKMLLKLMPINWELTIGQSAHYVIFNLTKK